MITKEDAKQKIEELVERFLSRQSEYEEPSYLERQLQNDFLNKLFEYLGWDLSNEQNLSPKEREVLVEKGDTKGRPDYSFRLNGEDIFFVEAKAVSAGTEKQEFIFQTKGYGWNSKKVNITVLTDFKTFKVYDSSLKPEMNRKDIGLIFELICLEYAKSAFEKLWLFSKQEVQNGSLEKLLSKDAKSKRLRIPVDSAFLKQMTKWREQLAKDVYKHNSEITVFTLNDVVQRILDRLVFIRLLEDRKIIDSRTLKEIVENWNQAKHRDIQSQLNILFKQLNQDFNGEIFKTHSCETIPYDSKIVAEIIEELYPPKSPYNFAVIGVELLGIIYEQYLGKTIRLTEKRIKVEEKPEVRKAGGVYYTPKWVVNYIVENTVGKLIAGRTPDEITKLKILDPACGSGSFLIGALECLFDYHLKYYTEHPNEAKKGTLFPNLIIEKDDDGNEIQRLGIIKKSQILKNNIFGVDIDPQAAEITTMSLYIKALEGEKSLPHKKELLPSLSDNIKCGNSLVGFDYTAQQTLFQDSEREKVNPFEWKSKDTGFGKIFDENKGFDAIIGNPPYIRIQTLKETSPKIVDYFSKKYQSASKGNYDIYVIFVEKATELINQKGIIGFILPSKFSNADYGEGLRKLISEKQLLKEFINFKDQQVFEEATTYTCLLFLTKSPKKEFKYAEISAFENPTSQLHSIQKNIADKNKGIQVTNLESSTISASAWQFGFGDELLLLNKLKSQKIRLGDIASNMFQGIVTSADPIYLLEVKGKDKNGLIDVFSKHLQKNVKIESEILHPLLKGQEIKRYSVPNWKYVLLFPYNIENGPRLITDKEFEKKYPKAWQYLLENKKTLENREKGKMKGDRWYAYVYPKNQTLFSKPKIMTQVLANKASFTYDKEGKYYFVGGGNAGGYGVKLKPESELSPYYITGLLNSKLLDFYLKKISTPFRGGFYSYAKRFIEQLPIYVPNKNDSKNIEKCQEIRFLAEKIIELNKKISSTPQIQREAKVYEEKIDNLVYKLYDLTQEEIEIVEGKSND